MDGPISFMSTAKIKNNSSNSRTGVVTLGIPFSRAENLQTTDNLVVSGALSGNSNQKIQWSPVGARWDNGGIKYAKASFKVDLAGNEEKTVNISKSPTYTAIPFVLSNALVTNFSSLLVQMTIQGVQYNLPLNEMVSNVIEGSGPEDHFIRLRLFKYFPNSLDPQIRYFWVELVLDGYSNLDFIHFNFRFGYYRFEPTLENNQGVSPFVNLNSPVTLRILGGKSKIYWEEYKIPSITENSATDRTYTLINPFISTRNRFAAGMSHAYKGIITFNSSSTSLAEQDGPILAMSENWKTYFPITGIMPPRPSYITSDADALSRSNTLLNLLEGPMKGLRDPYNWPTNCNNPDTASAGSHGYRDYAYGMKGWPFLSTCNYNWIPYLEFCTRQQATRHNWYIDSTGQPIDPDTFFNAGCKIWNGTLWFTNNGEKYRGFNRGLDSDNDLPRAVPNNQKIFGPDKEHYTNKLFVIQALVTMDYFSLEFLKMYSRYWIYANRSDNYGGFPSDVNSYTFAARAAGRVQEWGSFIYESTGYAPLKTWMKTALTYNLNLSRSEYLNKTIYPGGIERVRAMTRLTPCELPGCLNTLTHYRPWEEAATCLGFYFAAKAILNESPSDTQGLKMLEIARDIAANGTMNAYNDGRTTSNRRFFSINFNTESEAQSFLSAIGTPALQTVTNLTTGGSGQIYLSYIDSPANNLRAVKIHLKNATGGFFVGNVVRFRTGSEVVITRAYDFEADVSCAVASPSAGNGYHLTEEERDVRSGAEDTTYTAPYYPYNYLKYHRMWYVYNTIEIQYAVIAREAALLGLYSNNSAIIQKANDLITYFHNVYNVDNGDYEEILLSFSGYLVQNLLDTSVYYFNLAPLHSTFVIPPITTSIVVNSINAQASVESSSLILRPSTFTTTATSSISASVSVPAVPVRMTRKDVSVSAGSNKQMENVPVALVHSEISQAFATSYLTETVTNVIVTFL